MTAIAEPAISTDEFAERIFNTVLGTIDAFAIAVGDAFGIYDDLASHGSSTLDEVASRAGMHPRYAHEWLEQQVTTGVLTVDDPSAHQSERRYAMPSAVAEVLTDADSLAFLAPFVRLVVSGVVKFESLLEAYRSGGGVSWEAYGAGMRTGQADMNRPWFIDEIGGSWFPSVPELHERLQAGGRVADIGVGEGWSSIAIAQAYPNVTVDGYDIDEASIESARGHAEAAGVADRVTFHLADAATAAGTYDAVTAFECIHDLAYPTKVLSTMHRLAGEDGIVLVMDEAVADRFGESADEVERLMYGFSLIVCLPDGMSHPDSVGTGTVMRPDTLRRYATEAGFADVSVLPIQNDLWRFYRLHV